MRTALSLGVTMIAATAATAVEPWPHFRGDMQHTGCTNRVSHVAPVLNWVARTSGSIVGSPVMDTTGTIYVASGSGHVCAYDRSGVRRWAFDTGSTIFASPSIGPDGTIYVGNLAGRVYGINPDGTQRWVYPITNSGRDARVLQAPGIGPNGEVYVCSWDGRLHAFSAAGAHSWGVSLGGYLSASPAVGTDGTIYVVGYSGNDLRVYARNPANGSEKWSFSRDMGSWSQGADTYQKSSVCIDEARNRLYVGANCPNGGFLCNLNLASGTLVRWMTLGKSVYSAPSVGPDGTVYFGALDGRLYAYNAETGTERWHFQTGGDFIFGSPLVDGDGCVYTGASDGCLYKIRPGGLESWSYQTNSDVRSTPLIDENGIIYFGSHDSHLYSIGGPSAVRAWEHY